MNGTYISLFYFLVILYPSIWFGRSNKKDNVVIHTGDAVAKYQVESENYIFTALGQ